MVLGRFDKVLAYPESALPKLTEGIPVDGIRTELSSFSCSREGSGTALKLGISTVCDMPFDPPRAVSIGDICLE